jgi:TRAP-type C4-dicarboxylate transport system permease small subunit
MDLPGPVARLSRALGGVISWLFLAAVAISAYEVVMRYVFGAPSSWSNPTVTTLCAIGFALGGAYTMAKDGHIRIGVLADRMGLRARRIALIFGLCVGIFYLAGLGWGLWIQTEESLLRFGPGGWRPELTPGPPNWPLPAIGKAVLLASAILFLGVVAERLVTLLRSRDR